MPRTPRIHYRPLSGLSKLRQAVAACNLPRWLPDEEYTADRSLVTCGCCRNTYDWRYEITANNEPPRLFVLNPEFLPGGVL
jgi:hypothetical protein